MFGYVDFEADRHWNHQIVCQKNDWICLQSATFYIKIIKFRNDQPSCFTCSVEEVANLILAQNRTLKSLREFEH